ncbi:hypothetical protein BLGI_1488 [Brevibacillus laterosporus GI-9]|nr:hypothetical protein BLGI_1488 [Brevibacillus laterosporus GI-9]
MSSMIAAPTPTLGILLFIIKEPPLVEIFFIFHNKEGAI